MGKKRRVNRAQEDRGSVTIQDICLHELMKIIFGSRKKVVKSGLVLISGSWGSKIMAFGEEHGAVMGQTD